MTRELFHISAIVPAARAWRVTVLLAEINATDVQIRPVSPQGSAVADDDAASPAQDRALRAMADGTAQTLGTLRARGINSTNLYILKRKGLAINSGRGLWKLTPKGMRSANGKA